MARIFLSYARDDAVRAERIALELEEAGHVVWWDREISAGSSFSNEIDSALADAELVVVLWSSHSIRSDWVRDEAAIGRDSGRLVPALIDNVQPPLGFRQYQAVALTRSRQSSAPLVAAISQRLSGKGPVRARAKIARPHPIFNRRLLAMLAAFLVVLAIGAAWWLFGTTAETHTIAVVAASSSDTGSTELARSVARDLGRLRAGPIGSLTIVDPTDSKAKTDFSVEVGQSGSGKDLRADVAFTQRGARGLLWSSVIEEPGGRAVDLRQQVSAQIGEVLNCLAELGDLRRTIRPESLSLYLRGCSLGTDSQAIAVFRQLTEREPKFGPGWANLAMVTAWNVPTTLASEQRALIITGKEARDKALQYGPNLPETAVAVAIIRPSGGAKEAEILRIMDAAISKNPDSALLRATRGGALQSLGRSKEAIAEFARARDLNPLSPALLDLHASALAYDGNIEAAYAALAEAEKSWPGSSRLAQARFRLDLRFGAPQAAEAFISRSGTSLFNSSVTAYLRARADPSRANIEASLESYRAQFQQDPGNSPPYVSALAAFGRVDEAFETLKDDVATDAVGASADILFRPYFAKVRADPRFMWLAKRIGLVDVWQRTGVWPDFCAEPGLPYDCRSEAAKLRSVKALAPIAGG